VRTGVGAPGAAEAEWRKRTGRPMTRDELERVLRRYPGGRVGLGP